MDEMKSQRDIRRALRADIATRVSADKDYIWIWEGGKILGDIRDWIRK